jgi:phosphoglycerate dehydrogenase-like enzyme
LLIVDEQHRGRQSYSLADDGWPAVKILFIPQRGNEEPWQRDFVEALGTRWELAILDHDAPLPPQFEGVRVVVDQGGWATQEMIDAGAGAGALLWQVIGMGLDHSEVDHILARGIRLANTPGQFSAIALAEHALFLILCFAKRLRELERNVRAGVVWQPMTEELPGQTLGVVGLGASGRELARRARALEMRVVAVDPVAIGDDVLAAHGVEWCGGTERLDELLQQSDYVSLHVPLNARTRHLLDRERLASMKPSAVLVNVARGALVDEEALVDALREGRLRGAGLDVFSQEPLPPDSPFLALDGVIATPHVAGVTRGTSRRRAQVCVENIERIEQGLDPLYEITEW